MFVGLRSMNVSPERVARRANRLRLIVRAEPAEPVDPVDQVRCVSVCVSVCVIAWAVHEDGGRHRACASMGSRPGGDMECRNRSLCGQHVYFWRVSGVWDRLASRSQKQAGGRRLIHTIEYRLYSTIATSQLAVV